jgi:hypothetical protein
MDFILHCSLGLAEQDDTVQGQANKKFNSWLIYIPGFNGSRYHPISVQFNENEELQIFL